VKQRVAGIGRVAWKVELVTGNETMREVYARVGSYAFRITQKGGPGGPGKLATLDQLVRLSRFVAARLAG
jgi:hypothetical protein